MSIWKMWFAGAMTGAGIAIMVLSSLFHLEWKSDYEQTQQEHNKQHDTVLEKNCTF